jgi:hypothetical protein
MGRLILVPALLLAANLLQAGSTAPVYDASFMLDQGAYTGTTTFSVDSKGVVSGKMQLTNPIVVDAALGGEVKDGTWAVDYPYTIAEEGCSGTVKGTAKVSADRKTVTGEVTIAGACVEEPVQASFTFTRKAS